MMRRPGILLVIAVAAAGWLVAEKTILLDVVRRGDVVWRPATATDSVPRSIAEAEAEGQRFARSNERDSLPPSVAISPTTGGTSERKCVDVRRENAIRSGEFFAGPFGLASEYWLQPYGKLWWIPVHSRPLKTPVRFTLRIARLDTTGVAFFYASPTVTVRRLLEYRSLDRMGWASWTPIGQRGKWMFVARMHNEWGCFVFTV